MKWLAVGGAVLAAAGLAYWTLGRSGPAVVPFAKVSRGRLVSTLGTNARIEPMEWAVVRAPMAGKLATLSIALGDTVRAAQAVGAIDAAAARAAVVQAEAALEQARAVLAAAERGPARQLVAELEGELASARVEGEQARRRVKNLEALVASQAATRLELEQAQDRAALAEARVEALRKRRLTLELDRPAVDSARARVKEAESVLAVARAALARTAVVSPMAGTVYSLEVKPGAVLENGAAIAEVGRLEELRAIVAVDEPEMGRVAVGMPVEFTWDAQPGRRWAGRVEKMPARIVASGSRQVGEVVCRVENAGRTLPAGANVNATILSKTVEGALIAPKEALRRENGLTVAYVAAAGKLQRRVLKTGVSSITHVEVLDGLKEGDLVALPTELPLSEGLAVTPEAR